MTTTLGIFALILLITLGITYWAANRTATARTRRSKGSLLDADKASGVGANERAGNETRWLHSP